jgi:hypothetical protein
VAKQDKSVACNWYLRSVPTPLNLSSQQENWNGIHLHPTSHHSRTYASNVDAARRFVATSTEDRLLSRDQAKLQSRCQSNLKIMCSKRACRNCGKATWSGCGLHVESALRGVKEEDRCPNWKEGNWYPCAKERERSSPHDRGFLSAFRIRR